MVDGARESISCVKKLKHFFPNPTVYTGRLQTKNRLFYCLSLKAGIYILPNTMGGGMAAGEKIK